MIVLRISLLGIFEGHLGRSTCLVQCVHVCMAVSLLEWLSCIVYSVASLCGSTCTGGVVCMSHTRTYVCMNVYVFMYVFMYAYL